MVPDVKKIFAEHYPLIQETREILLQANILVRRNYDGDGLFIDTGDGHRKALEERLTDEEQAVIAAFFDLESNGVRIERFSPFTMDIAWRNLTRLEVMDLSDYEEEIQRRRNDETTAYFEEVYDGWYVMIIVSPPI